MDLIAESKSGLIETLIAEHERESKGLKRISRKMKLWPSLSLAEREYDHVYGRALEYLRDREECRLSRYLWLIHPEPGVIAIRYHRYSDLLRFDTRREPTLVVRTDYPAFWSDMDHWLPRPFRLFHGSGRICLAHGHLGWSKHPWLPWPVDGYFIRPSARRAAFELSYVGEGRFTNLPDLLTTNAVNEEWRIRRNRNARDQNRLRYWFRKSQAVMGEEQGPLRRRTFWGSEPVPPTPVSKRHKLTIEKIMAERNISIRAAMIRTYTVDRFMTDANAEVLDTRGEYALLSLPIATSRWNDQPLVALKMTCPSTSVVHVNPVHPSCSTVAEALDWMYEIPDYFGRLSAES